MLLVCGACADPSRGAERTAAEASAGKRGASPPRGRADAPEQQHAVTLAALAQGHGALRHALGAHEVSARSTLDVEMGGKRTKRVEQQLRLRVDAEGHFAAEKATHPQYGREVVWTGKWLYPRARYGKFVRRKPRPGEPERIADGFYGLLPAYVELLGPWLRVERQQQLQHEGREAVRVELKLRQGAVPPAGSSVAGPARRWRQDIGARQIRGVVLLDAKSGVPLRVDLEASWEFVPPARERTRSGIPRQLARGERGVMKLRFRQRVTRIGKVAAVAAPKAEDVIFDPRRLRLEIERQIAVGERALPHSWPRIIPADDQQRKRQ